MDFTSTPVAVITKSDVVIRVLREKGWKTIIEGLNFTITGKKSAEDLLTYLKKTLCCNGNLQSEPIEQPELTDEEEEEIKKPREKTVRRTNERTFTIDSDADFVLEKNRDMKKPKKTGPIFYVLHGDHRQTIVKYLESTGCRNITVIGGKA
jgi:translation initiation factor 1 (eIF-1/SUI1)